MILGRITLPTAWRLAQIEIQYTNKDVSDLPLEIISNIKETFDCCIDLNDVALIKGNEKLWNAIKNFKNKGIRARFVTAVNEGNISHCRQLMKCGEVFHNDKAKGNCQIVDGIDYLCYIIENESEIAQKQKKEQQLFYTNTKSFVDIQQYLFDNLCTKAITAREKIKEVEKELQLISQIQLMNLQKYEKLSTINYCQEQMNYFYSSPLLTPFIRRSIVVC